MPITLEQVERLREKSGASYSDCQSALERTDGDLLEAMLLLEREGKSVTAPRGGFYSTQGGTYHAEPDESRLAQRPQSRRESRGEKGHTDWNAVSREVWQVIVNIARHATSNRFEVWRNDTLMTSIPVLVLVILAIVAFWIVIPLVIVGLFFNCRYRFAGPDLGRDSVNDVMDNVSATVGDMVEHVKQEFKSQSKKHK